MEKQPTNARTSLIAKLKEPNPKIIATWQRHEKKTIEAWCQNKISDFEPEEFNELEVKLIRLQRFVGTSRLLGDDEMEDLIEYLSDEFPDFASDEIVNAVKLAVAGKLAVTDGRGREIGAEHFNEFGALYLQRILRPYQNFRGSIIRKYYDIEEQMRREAERAKIKPPTEEQQWALRTSHAISCFDSYKNGGPMAGLHLVHETLLQAGLFPNEHEERFEKFKALAKQNVEIEARKGNTKAKSLLQIMQTSDILTNTASLEHEAKVLMVKAYFAELKQTDKELRDELAEKPLPKPNC